MSYFPDSLLNKFNPTYLNVTSNADTTNADPEKTSKILEIAIIFGKALSVFSSGARIILPSVVFHVLHKKPALLSQLALRSLYVLSKHPIITMIAIPAILCTILTPGVSKEKERSPSESVFIAIQSAGSIATLAEIALVASAAFFPPNLTLHVGLKCIALLASSITNAQLIKKGVDNYRNYNDETNSNLSRNKKIWHVFSGVISLVGGVMGLTMSLQTAAKLYRGLQAYQKLDEVQKIFALKYHSLETLGDKKSQNAVIINGLLENEAVLGSNDYKQILTNEDIVEIIADNTPDPLGFTLYQECNTRTYSVSSPEELASVLANATEKFGKKLDTIAFIAHSDVNAVTLANGYDFTGTAQEIDTVAEYISSNGNILLAGCHTATTPLIGKSLAERMSRSMSNVLVTGTINFITPWQTSAWVDEKGPHVSAWRNGRSIIRVLKGGVRI